MSSQPVLETRDLHKQYMVSGNFLLRLLGRTETIDAVDGVDLSINENEIYGIVGESGSGKSTLIECLLRLEEPTSGSIYYKGEDTTKYDSQKLRDFRKSAQIIFQDPYESLNPRKTVFQTVSEPLRNFYDYDEEEIEERVTEILYDVGLRPPESFIDSYPKQLSGGQRQRVNIARAVILEPDLLVADEPVSMLDVSLQSGILRMLKRLQSKIGFSMFYVSHNLATVELISDRIAVMYRGKVVESGRTDEIISNPMHPYTDVLLSSIPTLSGKRKRVSLAPDHTKDHIKPTGCNFHPRCPEVMEKCKEHSPELSEVDGRNVACFLHHDDYQDDEA